MSTLRHLALQAIQECDPFKKVELTRQIRSSNTGLDTTIVIDEPMGLPGRPLKPELVPYTQIKQFSIPGIRSLPWVYAKPTAMQATKLSLSGKLKNG